MDQQELNNYFASRMADAADDNNLNIAQTKYEQLQAASNRAYEKNSAAAAQRKALLENNKSSFIGRLDIDEDSFGGQVLNNAAALTSGASKAIGFVASLPANVGAAAEMQGISQEEMAAFAAKQQGVATPEQEALLQRSIRNQGGAVDLWRQFQGLSDTVEGRIQNAYNMNKSAQGIADTFDVGSIVNRTGQANLEEDLRTGFQENWNKVTEGSATDKVAGVAGLLKEAVAAGINNKDGLVTFLSENIPQMALGLLGKGGKAAMLATNVGYGFDNFQKGIEEFQKENGRMPAEEELNNILGWSAAGALAEQIGDVSVLRGFGVGKEATQAASGAATKRGVGATVAGIGTGTAQGFGSEAATEAFQTFAENQAQGKETSAEDLYVAGSIGGLVGGAMRGGLSTAEAVGQGASTVAEKGAEFAQAQAEKKAALEEAVKTGDVSKYTDPTSATYAPDTAVEALYAVARNSTDPGVSSVKLQEANSVVSSLREELNTIEKQLTAKTAEQTQLEDQDIDGFTVEQIEAYEKQLESLDNDVAQLTQRKEQLTKPLARSEKVMEQFTRTAAALTPQQKAAPKSTQEVDGVINLSMAAPTQISDEALAALASNPQATDSQKAYASAALAFRAASKTAEQVNTNVLYGEANGLKGIQQYRKDITTSVAAGDTSTATKQLNRMKQFTARHKSKAEVAAQVLAERQASGDTTQVTIAPDSQGVWGVQPNVLSEAQRKKVGGLNIHKGSVKVVAAAQSEVQALDAAVAEMEAAIATKATTPANPSAAAVQSPAPTQSSSAAEPASSTTTATAPSPSQRQSQDQTKNVWYGTGENANLSNLAKRPFIFQGKEYQSVEHAYQSLKSGSFDQDTFNAYKGVEGKKITGKKGTRTENNWNVRLMERLVLRSFQQNPEAMKELKATGNASITHTQDRGVWAKEFPRILQAVRDMADEPVVQSPLSPDNKGKGKEVGSQAQAPTSESSNQAKTKQATKQSQAENISKGVETEGGKTAPSSVELEELNEKLLEATEALKNGEEGAAERLAEVQAELEQYTNTQEEVEPVTPLSVFAKPKEIITNLAEQFTKINLVSQFFKQRKMKADEASSAPLASVKDFMSSIRSGSVKVVDFLSSDTAAELSDEQKNAIQAFSKFARANAKTIEANILQASDSYKYQDMVKYLVEHGSVDENLNTAIALAAFSYVAENANQPAYNTDEDIKAMLDLNEFDKVGRPLLNALRRAGTNERNIVASLGQKVVSSLGLQVEKDAPENLMATLQTSLGAQAWKLLDQLGYLKRTEISAEFIKANTSNNPDSDFTNEKMYFGAFARNGKDLIPELKSITDSQKKTGSILNKLFGVEADLIAPTTKPVTKVQDTTAGTNQKVPSKMKQVLKHENSVPNYLRQDTWGLLQVLGNKRIEDVAGFNRVDPATLHKTERDGVEAKNDGLLRQIDNAFDFFGSHDPDAPIFFEHSIWKQHRVGIKTNMINPQTSKFHRFLVSRPEWESKVKMDDAAAVQSLMLRIGEGLGVKTDKQANVASLAKIESDLKDPRIIAAVDALRKSLIEGQDIFDAEKNAIVAGVKEGGENMHSLDALIALAYLRDAQDNGKPEITVKLMGEIDGVTNGPMLSHLLMGAAATAKDLFGMLNRGGFFSVNDEDSNYNVWRGKPGNQDLYETTISHVLAKMNVPVALKTSFYAVVGQLEENSKILKDGRNIIKTPLTAMVFGSSLDGAVDSMFDAFMGTVYTKMAEATNTNDTGLVDSINYLLAQGGSKAHLNPRADLRDIEFNAEQEAALRNTFDLIIGNAVKDTMETDFAVFMESRKTVNDAAQAAFKIYDAARKGITEKFMADKMEAGEIAFRTLKNGTKEPIHDLTSAQKEELGALLLPVTPVQATLMALDSNEADAGLAVSKSDRKFSRKPYYQQQAKFGSKTSTGTASARLAAYEYSLASPGVAMLVMSVHSTDSAISHNALMGFGEPTQVLNVHDAHGSGLQHFERTARNLNRATWDAMLRYSPATEMNNTLQRTIAGMNELMANPEYAAVVKPYLKSALKLGTKKEPKTLEQLVSEMATTAYLADKVKYETLAQMSDVDQYALEGGQYEVTNDDRAEAAQLAAEAQVNLPTDVMDAVASLEILAGTRATAKPVDADPEYENETRPAPAKALARTVAPAQVAAVASVVSPAVAAELDAGNSVEAAIASQENPAQVVQTITQAVQKVVHAFSPWGELGQSAIEHDQTLLEALQAKPVLGKADILAALRPSIIGSQLPWNIREFNAQIYRMLLSAAPENLEVRLVTPETSSNDVMGKGAERSRGWFMAKGGANQIYVLSPDHKYSGITPELILHEMIHATLATLIETSNDPEVKELISNLEALRAKAIDYMKANNLNELSPAVTNVHEFISWGMTNLDFQIKVLSRITGKAPRASNSLIDGVKAFSSLLVAILFRKSDKSHQAKAVNGMTLMIKNTAGLIKAAKSQKSEAEILLNMASVDPFTQIQSMTSEQLYSAIADSNPNNQPSAGFSAHLLDTLNGLASSLHSPMTAVIRAAKNSTVLTPLDAFNRAVSTGRTPFAARSLAAGFKVNNQEAFVMENVEAAVRAALNSGAAQTTSAYSELKRVNELARKQVRPMDLLSEGVKEATATPAQKAEAKVLWEMAFRVDGPDYMAKFVALALGNEAFASKLGFDASREVRDANNLWDRIMQVFDRMVNLIIGKLTKTRDVGTAAEFIKQLAQDVVDIEAKRRKQVLNNKQTLLNSFENVMDKSGTFAKEKVEAFSKAKFFANAKNGYIRGAGTVVSVVASPERALGIMDAFNAMRKDALSRRQDLMSSLVSEMRGLAGTKDVFLKLLMATKNIERERSKMGEYLSKTLKESFARKNGEFTKQEQRALTQMLHNDIGSLTNQYTMAEIQQLMEDPKFLEAEIKKFESKVRTTPFARAMVNMTRALGYYMATGVAKHPHLLRNAHNIARMGGTPKLGSVNESLAIGLEANIDVLASLYAMQYTDTSTMNTVKNVLREEMNRTDGGNGVEVMLKVHRDLQAESKKSLFEGNEALAIKGYLPEVTNPYITFKIADEVEGAELERLGYVKSFAAAHDPQDPTGMKHVYIIRDGGIARWNSGAISFTGNQRKGTANQKDNSLDVLNIHTEKMKAFNSINSVEIDPRGVQESYMVPVLNNRGQVVNYVYTASHSTRDNMLERDNRFDHLLGTLAGNTYDKVESPDQNKAVLEALKAQYDEDLSAGRVEFIRIAKDSEFADLWNMLPDQTKKDAEAIFGGQEIFMRNDMEDLIFGYRKQSMANLWNKENRKAIEQMFVDFVEMLMRSWARMKGYNEDDWAKRAPMYVRNGEDIWQSIVTETKDIIVVRTGVVLWGNIMSNFSVLSGYGVPIKDMIRHHRVALKAATAYEKDSAELTKIRVALATGVLQGSDRADLEDKAKLLEDSIARNPVKELIDAGLMPTIVEDLGNADDIYSYKNQLARKVEKYTNKLNPTVKKGLELAYMGQKTPLYQGLNRATQLSDFVARYTLYHYLQERKNQPLSRSEATTRASDAFVNYDIPTHRSMQYMNDMGFLMFTKYYLRIQRVILQMFAEKPARMLMMSLFSGFFNGVETVLDSNVLSRLGNNPFTTGALRYPTVLDDLATVNAAISLK